MLSFIKANGNPNMTYLILVLITAFLADWIFKDPVWLFHPVRAIGFSSVWAEKIFRKMFKNNLKIAGVLFLIFLILFWIIILSFIVWLLSFFGSTVLLIFWIYLTFMLLAFGSLVSESRKVAFFLKGGEIEKARYIVQMMVSRDLSKEDERGIARATIETVTENISDGVIAPIFYFAVGGPVLMFVYKIVNTLDSMVGYKNEKYKDFGWASARFDDLVNYIPARITGALIVATAFILGDEYKNSIKAWARDAQKGPSPNGGIPITTFAGARNIKLGGPCQAEGKTIEIPFVGGKKEGFGYEEILVSRKYVVWTSFIMLTISSFILV